MVRESVQNPYRIRMKCARVLWTQRAYHKTGGLSTQRAEKSPNPHIKSSRGLIRFSSRDSHKFSENLVEIHHTYYKSSRDSHHHSSSLYHTRKLNLVESATSSYHLVEMCAYPHIRCIQSRYMLSYVHTLRDTHTSCINVCTRSRQTQNVGMTLRSKRLIGRRA